MNIFTPDLILYHAPSVYDFREHTILYGPTSDVVPSTTAFEMYPLGFTSLAAHLERHKHRVRIVNLAQRMLRNRKFDAEKFMRQHQARAFGIDLHWLPHAHGAIEIGRILKRHHPDTPIIMGGFSATYFHRELFDYPWVDYVIRGDSAEEPLRQLIQHIKTGSPALADIPNLCWRDTQGNQGAVQVNPITNVVENLDEVRYDYGYVVRSVVRYADLLSVVPYEHWLDYPATAVLTCRGCTCNCKTCGGSATTFKRVYGRERIAYRSPEKLADDMRYVARFSRGPIFVLGDIQQPGGAYAARFLRAIRGFKHPVIMEFFNPPPRPLLEQIAAALPDFTFEISMESHDPVVRRAFGRNYTNAAAEEAMKLALDLGCQRFDVFFMVGLVHQTTASAVATADYCAELIARFDSGSSKRLFPFIAPVAPFLDPGSIVYENPERYGHRLIYRTLEEHRQALLSPSWKYMLNYETEWMTRDEIVAATYEAGLRLNRAKGQYGLITPEKAGEVEARARRAITLIKKIDDIMAIADAAARARQLAALEPEIAGASLSTVCEKRELDLPMRGLRLNFFGTTRYLLGQLAKIF